MADPKIIDLGFWQPYTPAKMPDWAADMPPGSSPLFSRRVSDGVDWYEFRKAGDSFTDGYLLANTTPDPLTPTVEVVQGVFRAREDHPVPFGVHVIEIEDLEPSDDKPWKAYEQHVFDPAALKILDLLEPPVLAVMNYQFAGQAAAEGIISDDDAMAWAARGEVPSKLIEAVKEKVTDPDRQKARAAVPGWDQILPAIPRTDTAPRRILRQGHFGAGDQVLRRRQQALSLASPTTPDN